MGIALNDGAIHECPGITFIGITDNVLGITLVDSASNLASNEDVKKAYLGL